MPNRTRGSHAKSTNLKGLGYDHQQNRDRLIRRHTDGNPCWWCNRPMFKQADRNFDGQSLHADHTKSRAKHGAGRTHADRLLHDLCNKQRGDGSRDHMRPALQYEAAQTQERPLGHLVLAWPA